jgi:hypothetical protein
MTAMTLIETKTLISTASSIEFLSGGVFAQYDDLVALVSLRATTDRGAAGYYDCQLRFNDVTSGYSTRILYGNGSSAASFALSGTSIRFGAANDSGTTANTFSNALVYIPNINSSSSKSTSSDGSTESNTSTAEETTQEINAGLSNVTSAITKLAFFIELGTITMAIGCSISLYGITKGSDGIVTTS